MLESNVRITGERDNKLAVPQATLAYGDADVAWQTVAFKKIKFATRENIGLGPVDIPAQNLQTTALWLAPDDAIRQEMKAAGLRASEGVVGMRNLAMVALPLVAMCDSRDLGGVVDSQNLGRTTMILYDRYPGGLGYCERGFAQMPQAAGDLPGNGPRLPVRRRLPKLRRPAESPPGHPQRPRPHPRLPDAQQAGDGSIAGTFFGTDSIARSIDRFAIARQPIRGLR